jgi:hypothetical protein
MPVPSWKVSADVPTTSRVYTFDILPLMQSLLATLADIDLEHECELERFSNSGLEFEVERLIGEALHANFQQRREPYVRSLKQLQQMR